MLFLAHCCKASCKISWDRRCAYSKITVLVPGGSFTSSLTLAGEGLGSNLSSGMKLSSLSCRFSISNVVGNGKVCFDLMQPMLCEEVWKQAIENDYFSIFGKATRAGFVHVMSPSVFCPEATAVVSAPPHHSPGVVFIC